MANRHAAVLACVAAVSLALPSTVLARKMAAISTHCPDGTKRSIDVDGERDACVASSAPTCDASRALTVDAEGTADQCVSSSGAASAVPQCAAGKDLKVREGEDKCNKK